MAFKARELPDSDARVKTELLAAAMTTAAAGFEVGASYVDQVVVRYGANSVTGRGAAATLGRLKLWGAGLAGMGGFVLAWWDFVDANKHFREAQGKASSVHSQRLGYAYRARGAATIVLALAEAGTAIALAKPFFDYLSLNNQNKTLRVIGRSLGSVASRLGTQAARLLLARLVLGTFWLGLILTVLIYIFEDDALEKWCKRSSYRLEKNTKSYDEQEELAALYSAFSEAL
ncbi:hypothetical protein LOY26_13320 [Pseudomonas sp. B21-047]|nr:hypothetical protein [Pseudomonas sp. B21-047]UVL01459.1 hypothetical protein LOY26_13320 [Pseudomonas sp. B21-047]